MWYNTKTKTMEGNVWGGSMTVDSLLEDGSFIGGTYMGFQSNMPNVQSAGILDYTDNEILFYDSDSIYAISRTDGSVLPTRSLNGLSNFSNIVAWSLIYTGIENNELGIYDKSTKQLHLFDKTTLSLTSSVDMPLDAPGTPANWGIAYANDIFWLYQTGINDWIGFTIFETKSASIEKVHSNFNVFPNPTHHFITLTYDKPFTQVEVLDVTGKMIKTFSHTTNQLSVADLPSGLYTLQIIGDDEVAYSKFIKN